MKRRPSKTGKAHNAIALASSLKSYAVDRKMKLPNGTPDHQYWQGVADACRKILAVYRNDDKPLADWADHQNAQVRELDALSAAAARSEP